MGKPRPNYTQLASDLLRGNWLLSGAAGFLPAVMGFLNRQVVELPDLAEEPRFYADGGEAVSDDSGTAVRTVKTVAVIPLHGAMTKYDTCTSYGTTYIGRRVVEAARGEDVAAVVLDIDSGGGASNSVAPIVEAIRAVRAMGKPVLAHCDMVASAAYWVASQCDAIYMDNRISRAGSIGALARVVDDRAQDPQTGWKIIEIYPPESSDKNRAYRDALDGDYKAMEKELSVLVSAFRDAVTSARAQVKADAPGVMTGALFYSGDAVRNGLADGVKTLQEVVEIAFALADIDDDINQTV